MGESVPRAGRGAVMAVRCPGCHGERRLSGIGCGDSNYGCRLVTIPCRDCGGTGEVSEAQMGWRREGDQLRALRMTRDLSLREAARLVGLPASDYSDAEHGRVSAAGIIEALTRLPAPLPPRGA